MFEIKKMTACTFEEVMTAWNKGFEGYFADVHMGLDDFLRRMTNEDLSPEYSIVAFKDGQPIGIVMNGVRTIQGKKICWNGGTGVAMSERGTGVGKKLIQEALKIYEELDCELATLEAIEQNEPAIALYESVGYEIKDLVAHHSHEGSFMDDPNENCTVRSCHPNQLAKLSFYHHFSTWQTQVQSAKGAEALIAYNEQDEPIGYALFRKNDELKRAALYQCVAAPQVNHPQAILKKLLYTALDGSNETMQRTVVNLPVTDPLHSLLQQIGFQEKVKQVTMVKMMK